MTDSVAHSKSRGVFIQVTSHVLDDVAEVTVGRSKRVSSGLTDVVVALYDGEKGDGFAPSSTVEDVFGFVSSALLVALPFLLPLVSSTDVLVLIPTDTSWLRNSSFIAASPANNASQSMAWLDALNFNRMTYEYIFSWDWSNIPLLFTSGVSSTCSPYPKNFFTTGPLATFLYTHIIRSSPSFGMANVCNLLSFLLIIRRASLALFIQPDSFAFSILVQASRMGCFSFVSFGMNLLMVVSCRNKLRVWFGLLGVGLRMIACILLGSALSPSFVTIWPINLPSFTLN
ncbi:hypothetical protein Tco_0449901 [Tanacetum coccineum]